MRVLAPLAALLLLAGCLGEPPGAQTAAPAEAEAKAEAKAEAEAEADGAVPAGVAAAEGSAAPGVWTKITNGTIRDAGVGMAEPVRFCCPGFSQGENIEGTFVPGPEPLGILVELHWDDPRFDLDLRLRAPDYEFVFPPEQNGTGFRTSRGHAWSNIDGQLGAPDGHAVILLTDPEVLALAGEWAWRVSGKTALDVPFQVAVSVFHGAPPGEGFSAFAASG